MLRCAYLTMADMGNFVSDAALSIEPMAALGWTVDWIAWQDSSAHWDDFDAVYICTPWDYPQAAQHFVTVLEAVDRSRAVLVNDIELVRWSLEKTYLRDLESRGACIVPSVFFERFDRERLPRCFDTLDTGKVVVKPVVGANAVDTFVLARPVSDDTLEALQQTFADRAVIVQPFVESIRTEGEYSLFFFAGEYSHAIRKLPKAGDFRVQEEHGASIESVSPPAGLTATAAQLIGLLAPVPVYVRADFVRAADASFQLMELEMIEPSLYLRTDPQAAQRFAAAFDAHVRRHVS